MYLGLTGGIGSGKSTAARMFADLGAIVIDADAIAKEVLEPGQVGYESVVNNFGEEILDSSGNIDRVILAGKVFGDTTKLKELEEIVHPAVATKVAQIRESLPAGSIIIYDTPLLIEKSLQQQFDQVIVVLAPEALRTQRLLARGLAQNDIIARMSNQATDEQRREIANYVIDNSSTLVELREEVQKVWTQICA
ncbi:MAG: dephospho-CoA kinase [Candidatus Nanopelagicales bacterium]|nr:dephospho-CoA kinase [Candidatus Nanopelagicales bacterium]